MELGGGVPLSEDNGVRGFPGLDYQTGCVPTTPVKPVPARQQRAEGDKELHWLSTLGISSAAELPVEIADSNGVRGFPGLDFQTICVPTTPVKPVPARQQMAEGDKELHWLSSLGISSGAELPVENPDSADGSYSGTAGISLSEQVHHLNVPAVYDANWQRQAYQDTAARLGQNFHGGNIVCGFTGFCSAVTQVSSPVMQPSLPTALYPGDNGGWYHQRHQYPVMPRPPSNNLWQQNFSLDTNKWSNACLSHTHECGFPFPCNTGIKAPNSSKTQVVDAPLAPVTPEKTTRKENVLDSSASTPIGLCAPTEPCTKEKVHKDNQQNSATPSKVPCADSKGEPSAEKQNNKRQVDDSQQSLTEILVKERISTDKAHVDGVDLSRTPPQKPKRKKVRPKVVREGKPRKTPNKEQASQRQEGTPVHRRRLTSTGRRKHKDATTTTLDLEESVCLPNADRVASCRRSLNFDSDGEGCNDKFGSIHQHAVERGMPTAGNPTEPAVFDLNGSLNNILASHLPLSENSSPSLLKRKASSRWNAKNMARKKNSVDNGYISEKHQGHFVNNHESAGMPGSALRPFYDTSQQDDTIISTESQTSNQAPTTCSGNTQTNPHGSTFSTGLVQALLHAKGGPFSMDLLDEQNRHIQTSSSLRPHPFQESFKNSETEASPQEQQSYVLCSIPAQKGSSWEVRSVTTETSNKVVLSQSGSTLEKQNVTERSSHVHRETSLKQSEEQQSHITQCYPGEKHFNFQNVQECNDMLVHIQVKAKRSPRKAPTRARHSRTFLAISHGLMPQSSTQEREDNMVCGPQTCQEALLTDTLSQKTTKKRRMKGISHAVKSAPCTTVDRPETCTHQGQESQGVLSSSLVNKHDNMAIRAKNSVHDCQSSSNLKENLTPTFSSEVISFMKPIDEMVNRLRSLDIREKDENAAAVLQNAIVSYSAEGTIVPYAGTFKPLRKRRPRPKVDLDEETNIAWKLLMGIESAGMDGTDADKEKWWEEQRRVFRGRADSFIARMHLIQGIKSSHSSLTIFHSSLSIFHTNLLLPQNPSSTWSW